ncbi:DUF255 domain-containing protein [Nocardioides immobilis]|uniref:DUF255 domain-containing protein n=1 Tax=Nocardioides immobilis TaxID=2049295 RepID=UPI0024829001|nr:DUF255 domain-containing protein [Nocardioides immobilis]
MDATTSMTDHGGWPMTCVLDHDGNPFFASTYFPDQPRHGEPSFRQVLEAMADAWRTKPDDVRRVAANLREHLGRATALAAGCITEETLAQAVNAAGGGSTTECTAASAAPPKSPPSMCWNSCAVEGEFYAWKAAELREDRHWTAVTPLRQCGRACRGSPRRSIAPSNPRPIAAKAATSYRRQSARASSRCCRESASPC